MTAACLLQHREVSCSSFNPLCPHLSSRQEKTKNEGKKIVCEFEQLHQFLKDQERLLLTQLADLDRAITRVQEEAVAKVSEEMSHLDTLIWEMEGKFQQPASQFLRVRAQSIRDGGERRDRAKPETWDPKFSPMGAPWCLLA